MCSHYARLFSRLNYAPMADLPKELEDLIERFEIECSEFDSVDLLGIEVTSLSRFL
jgi:hypothetical protein